MLLLSQTYTKCSTKVFYESGLSLLIFQGSVTSYQTSRLSVRFPQSRASYRTLYPRCTINWRTPCTMTSPLSICRTVQWLCQWNIGYKMIESTFPTTSTIYWWENSLLSEHFLSQLKKFETRDKDISRLKFEEIETRNFSLVSNSFETRRKRQCLVSFQAHNIYSESGV